MPDESTSSIPEEQLECVNEKRNAYPDLDCQAKNLAYHCAQSRFFCVRERTVIHQFNAKAPQIRSGNRSQKSAQAKEKGSSQYRSEYGARKSTPVSG